MSFEKGVSALGIPFFLFVSIQPEKESIMSTRPYGIVFWGFPMIDEAGEPVPLPWEEDDEVYADAEGVYLEKHDFPAEPTAEVGPALDRWRQDRKALLDGCPITVEIAGRDGAVVSLVALKESFFEVSPYQEIVQEFDATVSPEWSSQLYDWCVLMRVEYREPGWHVAALCL
jgi:hypothetical protein